MTIASTQSGNTADDQAPIIKIRLSDDDWGTKEDEDRMFELDDELRDAITKAQVGEYDGHEFGTGNFTVYIYGASAEQLFEVAWPILALHEFGRDRTPSNAMASQEQRKT